MPKPDEPRTFAGAPLRERLRYGTIMATTAFLVLVLPVSLLLAILGAAAGWWFAIGPGRGAVQGIAFGLIALAIGWIFTMLRYLFRPDLIRRPRPGP